MSFRNDVVVRRRVRRREPKSDIPLELITCNDGVCSGGYESEKGKKTNVSSCSRRLSCADGRLQPEVSTGNNQFHSGHIPNACWMPSVDAIPSNWQNTKRNVSVQSRNISHLPSLSSYYLGDHGPRSRSVQPLIEPLPGSIDPAFEAQLQLRFSQAVSLRTSLIQIEQRYLIHGKKLTESSLFYLFCGKSKHRKQFK